MIIGETAILGDNITLYQGVTWVVQEKEQGKRHPTLEDNVMVSAGAKVIGSFTIGKNSKIGAGSVVIEEVPRTVPCRCQEELYAWVTRKFRVLTWIRSICQIRY